MKNENNIDVMGMVDDLLLTSTKISNINELLDNQLYDTELKKDLDNFSKLYTLLDYSKEQAKILKDSLNGLWTTLHESKE